MNFLIHGILCRGSSCIRPGGKTIYGMLIIFIYLCTQLDDLFNGVAMIKGKCQGLLLVNDSG